MKLSEYFANNASEQYQYVGTAWGTDGYTETGAELAAWVAADEDYNGEMIDHPDDGGSRYDVGYYTESGDIWLQTRPGMQEKLFEVVS